MFRTRIARLRTRVADLKAQIASQQTRIAELEAELAEYREPEPEPEPLTPKPIAKGIFTRHGIGPSGPVKVSTFPLYWGLVEKQPGWYDWSALRYALDLAKSRGQTSVRIRPYLGVNAPQWVKEVGDGPVFYEEPHDGKSGTIPDLWDPDYRPHVAAFMLALADEVDDDDFVSLVFASGAMTYYAEPFMRGANSAANRKNLPAAGYTIEADLDLQRWQLDVMACFKRTNVGVAYNGLQQIKPDGTAAFSVVEMANIMDHHIDTFESRTVLQNNSIRSAYIASPPPMYAAFRQRAGVAHQFQCAATARVGDEEATIRWAKDYLGASGIEHSGTLMGTKYAELDALLKG